jgi:2',3'-cyclic-nucleotide 2'-phosphodiesterase (5'-nucleotidase family)
VEEYRKIANFPILSATVWLNGKLVADEPYHVFDVQGLKIGVLGLTTSEYINGYTILSPEEAVKRYLPEIRRRCDLVVALTHLGVSADCKLAQETSGIDIIVGGHSHDRIEIPKKVCTTLIVQAGLYSRYVGKLDLVFDRRTKKIVKYHNQLVTIPVPGLTPDPLTQKQVALWEGKVSDQVDVQIGYNPKRMSVPQVMAGMERAWLELYRTDFACVPNGNAREGLPAGKIRIREIYNIFPFNNTMVVLDLTREQINQAVPNAKFSEVKPLYTLVTNSYWAGQLKAKFYLPSERIHPTNTQVRDDLITYIQVHGTLNPTSTQPVIKSPQILKTSKNVSIR